jgi:hypothetical protein
LEQLGVNKGWVTIVGAALGVYGKTPKSLQLSLADVVQSLATKVVFGPIAVGFLSIVYPFVAGQLTISTKTPFLVRRI